MKVYLDNMIACARLLADLSPEEQVALRVIEQHPKVAKLEMVTSRESWREQERARNPRTRERLGKSRDATPVVPLDHGVLGFDTVDLEYRGFIASPVVTDVVDETISRGLKAQGLKDADARHLMYALCNGCERFITTDPDFLDRRPALEASYGQIRIMRPSEMVHEMEELGGDAV